MRSRLLTTLLALVLLAGVSAWAWFSRPSDPFYAPYSYGGPGGYCNSMRPVRVSLHEYLKPASDSHTTGKSITFEFPCAYFPHTDNHRGGNQLSISIHLDGSTELPSQAVGNPEFAANRELLQEVREGKSPRQISLELSRTVYGNGGLGRNTIQTVAEVRRGWPAVPFEGPVGEHCGLDAFTLSAAPSYCNRGLLDPQYQGLPLAEHAPNPPGYVDVRPVQQPPFDNWQAFARRLPDGRYYPVVKCTLNCPGQKLPLCTTHIDFEGWPLTLRFKSAHICDLDAIISQSRAFLTRHVIARTDRSPEFRTSAEK